MFWIHKYHYSYIEKLLLSDDVSNVTRHLSKYHYVFDIFSLKFKILSYVLNTFLKDLFQGFFLELTAGPTKSFYFLHFLLCVSVYCPDSAYYYFKILT